MQVSSQSICSSYLLNTRLKALLKALPDLYKNSDNVREYSDTLIEKLNEINTILSNVNRDEL